MNISREESLQRLNWFREALVKAVEIGAKLDMDRYVDGDEVAPNERPETVEAAHACGTVCCNAGWAGFHPELRKLGLISTSGELDSLKLNGDWVDIDRGMVEEDDITLADFFGITDDQAKVMFWWDGSGEVNDLRENLVEGVTKPVKDAGGFLEISYMTLEKSIQLLDVIISRY